MKFRDKPVNIKDGNLKRDVKTCNINSKKKRDIKVKRHFWIKYQNHFLVAIYRRTFKIPSKTVSSLFLILKADTGTIPELTQSCRIHQNDDVTRSSFIML